jgi:hypothetical protein
MGDRQLDRLFNPEPHESSYRIEPKFNSRIFRVSIGNHRGYVIHARIMTLQDENGRENTGHDQFFDSPLLSLKTRLLMRSAIILAFSIPRPRKKLVIQSQKYKIIHKRRISISFLTDISLLLTDQKRSASVRLSHNLGRIDCSGVLSSCWILCEKVA